jgi:hypothetical protein
MASRSRRLLAIIVLLGLAAALAGITAFVTRENGSLHASIARLRSYSGTRLPEVRVTLPDGGVLPLADVGADLDRLLVIFVRDGCPRCRSLLGTLRTQASAADPRAGVAIVEVGPAAVNPDAAGHGLPWFVVSDRSETFRTALGGRVVPVLMVLDRDRIVRAVYVGEDESRVGLEWLTRQWVGFTTEWMR